MKPPDGAKGAVLVTGASSGIGFALCRLLLAQDYDVAACSRNPGRLAEIEQARLSFHPLDVRDREGLARAVAHTVSRSGRIEGLVTCAAVFKTTPFLQLDDAAWDETFAINLTGTLLACQAVLPVMRSQRHGSIVLFSSIIARTGAAKSAHYAATKGGVLGLARSLALEVAGDGIRVNVVSPGITDTPQPRANVSDEYLAARAKEIPMGRIGRPEEMAEAALFLLTDDASYVTGQDIRLTGGGRLF
jgi:NAD(P)-dependent dehydrogenase (short-subunit alcohol dehydrogenase family)